MLKKIAVLAVILLFAFGGLLLLTRDATFAVEESLSLPVEPGQIWQILTAVDAWSDWWPGIKEARLKSGWQRGAALELVLEGNPEREAAMVQSVRPAEQIVWVRPGVLGSTTKTTWRLSSCEDGTCVSLESAVRGPQAFMARFSHRDFATYQKMVLQALQVRLQGRSGQRSAGGGE